MPSLVRRSNGVYYEVTTFHGRRIWRSTGATSKAEARRILREGSQPEREKPTALTLSQFASQFIPFAHTNYALGTVQLYAGAMKVFIRHMGDRNLKSYTTIDVERFKTLRLGEVSPVKVNIDFRTMKALFQTALKWGLIEKNPFVGVKQIRIPPQRPTFLTKEELSRLCDVIPTPWFRELVVFAVATMMRAGEIVNLKWDSIDLQRKTILIENIKDFRIKTTQPRTVPMNDWVTLYLTQRTDRTGYVFRFPDGRKLNVHYVSKRFKGFVRLARLPEAIHFHSLRHTGATWLVQDGASIYAVQKLLGHSSIQVTMGYSHIVTGELHGVINQIVLLPAQ